MKLWYRRKVEFEFPLTALLTWPGNRHRCRKLRRKPGVPRKGLQRDTSGEEFGLTCLLTCPLETEVRVRIPFPPTMWGNSAMAAREK